MNKSNLSLPTEAVDGIKKAWYNLQPICVGKQWYCGDWDGNTFVELLADNWLDAVAEINDIRDYVSKGDSIDAWASWEELLDCIAE